MVEIFYCFLSFMVSITFTLNISLCNVSHVKTLAIGQNRINCVDVFTFNVIKLNLNTVTKGAEEKGINNQQNQYLGLEVIK